jgi:hypothetical protein
MYTKKYQRRDFIKKTSIAGMGLGLSGILSPLLASEKLIIGKRVGIIGLDTSHSVAFTKALNEASTTADFLGYKIVAAYPQGSLDIKSSVDRIPAYTAEVKKYGVEIVSSIEALLKKVDVVLLETNDGRRHLEQAIPVLKAGKRLFIDKPIAASYQDATAIFEASKKYQIPVFSSSSLRYIEGLQEIKTGKHGKIIGVEAYSPAMLEPTHPDLYWYGIHGVEMLFALMGTGCKQVSRVFTADTDVVTGQWDDGRIGVFRGIRAGKKDFGALVFTEQEIIYLKDFKGYHPLLKQIVNFFETGIAPVLSAETLEICAFIEAADKSKNAGGRAVEMLF